MSSFVALAATVVAPEAMVLTVGGEAVAVALVGVNGHLALPRCVP